MRYRDLQKFINAREAARMGVGKDPIIAKYRFCNVHREDDRVTKWLRDEYYPQFAYHEDLWFSAVVARLFNYPDSLGAIAKFVLPYKPEAIRKTLHLRKAAGLKNFNAAYIVSTNGVAMEKVDYLIKNVLGPLWVFRKVLRPKSGETLEEYHSALIRYDGLGSFIAAQVIADLKYEFPWKYAADWHTFASSGPGSRRGLNRVMGREVEAPWKEPVWRTTLAALQRHIPGFHAQDLQNCLCEFDKYERARLGEGTPKQLYKEHVDVSR